MSPWDTLLREPHSCGHFVQLYQSDRMSMVRNVGQYLGEGLQRGDGVLVIATPEHWELLRRELVQSGSQPLAALRHRQLVFCDAQETLSRFLVDGQPEWPLFEQTLTAEMRRVRPANQTSMRAYGEMVAILWKARQFRAAIRLEEFWNKLLVSSSFSLYCSYAIDIFGKEFHVDNLDGLLRTHTHLVPTETKGDLETALNLAMDEILGSKADELRIRIRANRRPAWAVIPNAEALVLWLRKNLAAQGEDIVTRAKHYYDLLSQEAQVAGKSSPLLVPSQPFKPQIV